MKFNLLSKKEELRSQFNLIITKKNKKKTAYNEKEMSKMKFPLSSLYFN